jgi:predicted DNA-binding transcriptional regulator AlpA
VTRKLLSKKQFAEKINRSVRHVERLIETGHGPPIVHVGVRAVAIDEDDADRWIKARRKLPPGWSDAPGGAAA